MIETEVSIAIRGDDVRPEEVSHQLTMAYQAEFSFQRGDTLLLEDGTTGTRISGFVRMASTASLSPLASLEEHLMWTLEKLEPHKQRLADWQIQGWQLEIRILTATERRGGGPRIRSGQLQRLAALGIDVCIQTWTKSPSRHNDKVVLDVADEE